MYLHQPAAALSLLLFTAASLQATSGFVIPSSARYSQSSLLQMSATSKTSEKGQVVVVGSANQDLTAYTATVPKTGETVLGESFETSFGGKGANQGVAAAALDIAPVTMVCKVGADAFGTELLESFRKLYRFVM